MRISDCSSDVCSSDLSAISGDELSIHVLLDPRNEQVEADFNDGLNDGTACAHGWLERRLGAWIQDGGEEFSCKRAMKARVAAVKIKPPGYADQGSWEAGRVGEKGGSTGSYWGS